MKRDAETFRNILRKIRENEKHGMRLFYKEYGKMIYSVAYMSCHSKEMSDETVNDVLLKVWKMNETVAEMDNPVGWLYTVTANTARDKLRTETPVSSEKIQAAEEPYTRTDEGEAFFHMIGGLNEREQQIMIYRFVSDYTFEDIASLTGRPLSTVTSAYYRALQKIKDAANHKA